MVRPPAFRLLTLSALVVALPLVATPAAQAQQTTPPPPRTPLWQRIVEAVVDRLDEELPPGTDLPVGGIQGPPSGGIPVPELDPTRAILTG